MGVHTVKARGEVGGRQLAYIMRHASFTYTVLSALEHRYCTYCDCVPWYLINRDAQVQFTIWIPAGCATVGDPCRS